MTNKPKNYLLYADPEQTKLLAQAYSKEHAQEVSLEYDSGQWFSYDLVDEKVLANERKVKFPFGERKTAQKEEEKHVWTSLGGSNIR